MSTPTIHGNRVPLTASKIRKAIAEDLSQIKHEDGLTFPDIGRILGKSEDQAAKYCDGTAGMSAETYAFARERWNGRFTGTLDRLIANSRGESGATDRQKVTLLTKALLELSLATEDDGECDPREVRAMRKSLEGAREAIDELLRKLTLRAA